ncbi:protein translocase subunit SecD [Synoicihabitans lomoniglobus]|uniref:Multifunctional fusion protein n=1 Tax=Synoicihabitans lomoniglobus TaxID=2909285 RepID=A0AAF0I4Y8_9BACT|nr:protein translocase subunit SecD [Opitutaceae bacterium LMO-M01]WED66750.1 protein translocase subunit SecD [Opitutaceae bacterium LMO-M01]
MFKRNLWKITLTALIGAWAISSILPLKDTPFNDYIKSEASAQVSEFESLMAQASDRVTSGQAPSVFIALKQIGREQRIDLSKFFPEVRLEESLRNVEKRNAILLDYLLQQSKGRLQLGLDLKGGVAFMLEVADEGVGADVPDYEREDNLAKAIEIMSDRVNALGVTEPIIRPVGLNRIEIQLPGVNTKDNPELADVIKKPARLDFRRVHQQAVPGRDATPPGYEVLTEEGDNKDGTTYQRDYFVKRLPEMTGEMVATAFPTMDEYGRFKINLRFTDEGAERFGEVTGAIAQENQGQGGLLAIVLDGRLSSAPRVSTRINGGSAEITGTFTQREAIDLANVLNNPLDVELVIQEQNEIGPSLAADAIASGEYASMIAIALVAAFMIAIYTIGGLFAVISLSINLLFVLGALASLGATITMPGIAGIVLTVGMAVDSNILIFERIREELNLGKSLKAAFLAGHDKVVSTILDANITTLITSSLMIIFGTGPVKGFGVTLTIGVFSTVFCALVVTKLLLDIVINGDLIKKFPMLIRSKVPTFDYLKYARPAFAVSWLIVIVGVGVVAYKGHRIYGIDFVGGDEVSLSFNERPDTAAVRDALEGAGIGEVNPVFQSDFNDDTEILKIQVPFEEGTKVMPLLLSNFPNAGFEVVGQTTIGPSIGAEIQWNAFMSLSLAIVGILIYVAFRFEFGFGVGAVVSTIHDILMTIGIFVLFDRQFTAPMVAAILLIAGYSINDTIVVFDRIREELNGNPNLKLREVINNALNNVFVRSLLTSATTFLASLALFLFGGGVINDLAFTFLVGVITGTFSSIFIASPIFFWYHKGDRKHVEKHQDVKPTYEWTGSSRASE